MSDMTKYGTATSAGKASKGRIPLAERLKTMVEEKRGRQKPVPIDLASCLNQAQLETLHNLENFGWNLLFVRRALFNSPEVVISRPHTNSCALLRTDGTLNMSPDIRLRR